MVWEILGKTVEYLDLHHMVKRFDQRQQIQQTEQHLFRLDKFALSSMHITSSYIFQFVELVSAATVVECTNSPVAFALDCSDLMRYVCCFGGKICRYRYLGAFYTAA